MPGNETPDVFASYRDIFRMAFRALRRNRLRTALTMVGIMIAIAAVICTVAVGQGGTQEIEDQLTALGVNMIWIEAGGRNVNGVRTGNGQTKTLTVDDAEAILAGVQGIVSVAPNVDGPMQAVYGNQNWFTRFRGVSSEYFEIRNWRQERGALFTSMDSQHETNVCLLGKTVAETLFGSDDPLGKIIRLQNLPFTVIGIMQPKGLSTMGVDQDDVVVIPYTTAMKKMKGIYWLDDIYASASSAGAIGPAIDQIGGILRQRHHLRPEEPDDFNIRHPEETLQAREQASWALTLMLAGIASISLLVGGIGIMNIMLVSVTERTREIGVRLAVGATERDIQQQFLAEATAVSLLGGAAGILLGIVASAVVSRTLQWPSLISPSAIALAAIFSFGVGIIFGYYPARIASRLDPIEAIRYE
ncbi:MAG TPA: ABC transporter permease [Candidatus Acidoferrales bacterium]|jgi:putative ABC transport system permease protein|nr:ABC transporter permease [Candidatus Acidoferrales bacterium]